MKRIFLVALFLVQPLYGQEVDSKVRRPTMILHFNDNGGLVARNSVSTENNAALGSTALWVTGKVGSALQCDGTTNGKASIAPIDNASFDNSNSNLTAIAWIYPTSLTGEKGIITRMSGAGKGWAFEQTGNHMKMLLGCVAGVENSTVFLTNKWYRVGVTIVTGIGGATGYVKFYINGVLDSAQSGANWGPCPEVSGTPLNVGHNTAQSGFIGCIDDAVVYSSQAFTPSQMLDDYNQYRRGDANVYEN